MAVTATIIWEWKLSLGDGLYQAFMMILGWLIIKTVHLMAIDVAGKKWFVKRKIHSKSSPWL